MEHSYFASDPEVRPMDVLATMFLLLSHYEKTKINHHPHNQIFPFDPNRNTINLSPLTS